MSGANSPSLLPVTDLVRHLASHGLPSRALAVTSLGVSQADWPMFLRSCEQHRLLGLLGEAVRAGYLVVTPDQRRSLEAELTRWLGHALVVERELVRCGAVLGNHGIDFRILKGAALANTLYADPSLRVFADVDLLVPSSGFSAASEVLCADRQARRVLPELRAGFDDRFGREILLRRESVEIDLHRTLVDGPYGLRVLEADLFGAALDVALGGQVVPALGPTARFLHTCFAVCLGDWPPRLMVQRDLAEMLVEGPLAGRLDADEVLEMARRWRATSVVGLAIRLTIHALDFECDHPLVGWARRERPGPLDRLMLVSYRGRARGYTSQALSVLAIRGWRNRWDYTRAVVRPSRDYLAARGFRRGDRLRRALGLGPSAR